MGNKNEKSKIKQKDVKDQNKMIPMENKEYPTYREKNKIMGQKIVFKKTLQKEEWGVGKPRIYRFKSYHMFQKKTNRGPGQIAGL